MDSIDIIRVTLEDIYKLQNIGIKTFVDTFSHSNTKEDMQRYIEESFSFNKLINELKEENSEFYFAVFEDEVIGYLKLNFGHSQTELKGHNGLEIERIYVLRDYQGKNIGQLLYNKAINVAEQINVSYIWLGVWEQNKKAIGFYKKKGFVEFDKHIFRLGSDKQTDIMMKLQLK